MTIRTSALQLGAVIALSAGLFPATADAKTPGHSYCFLGTCHRVLTLSETASRIGKTTVLQASFYDHCGTDRYNPCGLTSSGEAFNAGRPDNAASPILPNGTVIMVRNPANGRTAVLRINNAGPYWGKRTLDVSRGAADALGFRKRGVAKLEIKVLQAPSKAEATYRRNRSYAKVAGPIGSFASIDAAGTHYAALTGKPAAQPGIVATAVAAAVPREIGSPQGRGSLTGGAPALTIAGNGIERAWMASNRLFKPTSRETRQAQVTATKVALAMSQLSKTRKAAR